MSNQKKVIKILSSTLVIFLFGIIILTFLSLFGIPKNFRIFVVESGSMEPEISTGSLAFVTPEAEYNIGDIITFDTPIQEGEKKDYVVTHRITDKKVENGETLFQTKGDANNTEDSLWTNQIRVIGKVSASVPVLGYIIGFAKTQIGFLLLIIIPSIILIYSEIQNISREFKRKDREKRMAASSDVEYEN